MVFAQLSDLHIVPDGCLAYGFFNTETSVKEAVKRLNTIADLEMVLVSGDLLDCPYEGGYLKTAKLLNKLKVPWFAIPGNHDGRELMRQEMSAFQSHFPQQGYLDYVIDDYPLRIIAMDSHIGLPEHAGILRPEQLVWLEKQLKASQKPTMLMLHHPPFRVGFPVMDAIALREADKLSRTIAPYKQLIHASFGHVHRNIFTVWEGVPVSIAPALAYKVAFDTKSHSMNTEGGSCRIFQFDGQNLLAQEFPTIEVSQYSEQELARSLFSESGYTEELKKAYGEENIKADTFM